MDTPTQTGIVKWLDDGKGFGFITPESGGEHLFAHERLVVSPAAGMPFRRMSSVAATSAA